MSVCKNESLKFLHLLSNCLRLLSDTVLGSILIPWLTVHCGPQEELLVTDQGHSILIFAPRCRVIQLYKWLNGQEIEF